MELNKNIKRKNWNNLKIFQKIIIVIIISSTISCTAQLQIFERFNNPAYADVNGAYYKDLTNFRNQYVGTWIYSDGNKYLKIIFINKNQIQTKFGNKILYEDYLVGEYQYIENGIEKVNTLNAIYNDYGNKIYDFNLVSCCQKLKNHYPKCNECLQNEKRLEMSLNEPNIRYNVKGFANSFILRTFTENGVQKLKVWFINESKGMVFDKFDQPTNINKFSLPFGQYILTKQ